MSSDVKLGELIVGPAERDAIHVAVVPLVAGEELYSGSKFRLAFGSTQVALRGDYNDKDSGNPAIGVVDPFLGDLYIRKGQRFWGVLFPGTVTGMRHHWQHPAFDHPPKAGNEHELWLRQFADKWNFDFEELISAGKGDSEYVVAQGVDCHSKNDLDDDEHTLFWHHLEAHVGKEFDTEHRDNMGWSCSC